jgi:hypothetical protein
MKRWIEIAVLSLGIVLAPDVRAADQPVSPAKSSNAPVNLVQNGDAETGTLDGWTGFKKVISNDPHSGKFCFSAIGNAQVTSTGYIPIDPNKTYTLTAWLKSTGQQPSIVYVGYVPYEADKAEIVEHHMVDAYPGTETTLVEACSPKDKILKIADGSKWANSSTYPPAGVAFDVDGSGKYDDLPNRKLTGFSDLRVENKGEYWEVHLSDACGQAYPAGTKVREHFAGGTLIYNAASAVPVPTQWTKYTGTIHGVALSGAPNDQWWHGTKYAQILLLLNFGQNDTVSVAVDDISMTVSDK